MTGTIDFRRGRWGHCIHASTFTIAPRLKRVGWLPKWLRRKEPESVARYSFLCHTSDHIEEGVTILWLNAKGETRQGVVYDWKCLGDPRDMFKVFVLVEGA